MIAQSCPGSTPCWKSQQEELGQERSPRSGRKPGTTDALCSSAIPGGFCITSLSAVASTGPCAKSWSLIRLSCPGQLQLGKFPAGAAHPSPLCWAEGLGEGEVWRTEAPKQAARECVGKVAVTGVPPWAGCAKPSSAWARLHPPTAISSPSAVVLVLTADRYGRSFFSH